MNRILRIALVSALVWTAGCAELATTGRIMNVALIELFRLPIFCLRLPFTILQNMGPILQSAVRTAANVAPLLLFIENQEPPRRLDPDPARPGELEEAVELALSSREAVPLLPLLDRETAAGPPRRFVLVDARLASDPRGRAALLGPLGAGAGPTRVFRVEGSGILADRERFLALGRRMRERGDMLVAATAFNDALSAIAGPACGGLPDEPEARAFVRRMGRALRGLESGAPRAG